MKVLAIFCLFHAVNSEKVHYEPNWDSLMTRPLPTWYDDAKIGIFMHWGVYSVPSFGLNKWEPGTKGAIPAEWYWNRLENGDPRTNAFHNKTYGPDYAYAEFAPQFTAMFFDPGQWARMFKNAGIISMSYSVPNITTASRTGALRSHTCGAPARTAQSGILLRS
jgi:alpha-L-fucosidase